MKLTPINRRQRHSGHMAVMMATYSMMGMLCGLTFGVKFCLKSHHSIPVKTSVLIGSIVVGGVAALVLAYVGMFVEVVVGWCVEQQGSDSFGKTISKPRLFHFVFHGGIGIFSLPVSLWTGTFVIIAFSQGKSRYSLLQILPFMLILWILIGIIAGFIAWLISKLKNNGKVEVNHTNPFFPVYFLAWPIGIAVNGWASRSAEWQRSSAVGIAMLITFLVLSRLRRLI